MVIKQLAGGEEGEGQAGDNKEVLSLSLSPPWASDIPTLTTRDRISLPVLIFRILQLRQSSTPGPRSAYNTARCQPATRNQHFVGLPRCQTDQDFFLSGQPGQ